MKNIIIGGLCAVCFTSNLYAVAYSGTNLLQLDGSDVAVVDNTGSAIVSGNGTVASGYFATLTDAELESATLSDVSALLADFVVLGSDDFSGFAPNGLYDFSSDPSAPSATPADGKHLYTFFGNNTTLEASEQIGLYQSSSVINDGGIDPEAYTINLTDGGEAIFGSEATHGKVQIDASSLGESSTFMTDSFTLVAVPEPSSTALLGLGGLALMLRRRR